MPSLTREHARVIDYLEAQGATVTRTTKGLMFRAPDGVGTATLHWTESDWRSTRNFRANIRRMGLDYPGDRPAKAKDPTDATKRKIAAAVERIQERGEPVTTQAVCLEAKAVTATVQNAMGALGWWHEYRKPGKRGVTITWLPPIENPAEVVQELESDDDDDALRIDPGQLPAREFLDTVDSWVVSLPELHPETTVAQLQALYAASRLHVELRVWRAAETR